MAGVTFVEPRPLSVKERAVLDLLLSVEFPGVGELRQQVRSAIVVGRCDCGCPTFDVEVDSETPTAALPLRTAPVELRVEPISDEPQGEVILFVDNGRLSRVEYVYYSEHAPREWPENVRFTGLH